MTLEARVKRLEKNSMTAMCQELAFDCMIKALIATHPNPAVLRTLYTAQVDAGIDAITEMWFGRGAPVEAVRQVRQLVEKAGNGWLQLIDAAPKSD